MKKESRRTDRGKMLKMPGIALFAMLAILMAAYLTGAITTMIAEMVSTSSSMESRYPAVSVGPNNLDVINVVWEDDTELNESGYGDAIKNGPDKDIFYISKNMTEWSSKGLGETGLTGGLEVISNESITSSENPDIATDYDNITHVVWQAVTKPNESVADSNTLFLAHFDSPDSFDADYAGGQASPLDSAGAAHSYNSLYNRSAYISGPGRLSYDAANNINLQKGTIEFWYNPGHWPRSYDAYYLFGAWNSPETKLDIMFYDLFTGYFAIDMSYNSEDSLIMIYYPPYELKKNTWHHLAFTYDFSADDCRFYFDGSLEIMNNSCEGTSFEPLNFSIGASQSNFDDSNWRAEGFIDELMLSNDVRAADEIRADAGQRDIFHRSLNGTAWSGTDIVTSDDSNNSYFQRIDVDRNNTLSMVWDSFHNSTYSAVNYKRRTEQAANWSAAEAVSNGPRNYFPDVAIDASNNSHVVWQNVDASSGNFSGFSTIQYRKRGQASWDSIVNVSNRTLELFGVNPKYASTSYVYSTPRIAIGGSNETHIVWSTQYGFPDNDLLFYLSFDDMSPNVTFANGSVESHANGTYIPAWGEISFSTLIHTGYAAYVNDTFSYLNYSASNNLNADYGTIMEWVKPLWEPGTKAPLDTNMLFMYYSANVSESHIGGYISFYIKQCDGTVATCSDTNSALLYFHIYNSTTNYIATYNISDWEADEWHHIAATWNLSGGDRVTQMYIDGDAVQNSRYPNTTDPITFNATPTEIIIGNAFNESTNNYPFTFNGTIDEVMVFERILREDEIMGAATRDLDIVYRQKNDSGWQKYEFVSELSNDISIMPSVAAKDDYAYVVWPISASSYDYLSSSYKYGAFYKIAINTRNSTSWRGLEQVNDESIEEAYAPDVEAMRAGKIDIVWEDTMRLSENDINILYREFANSTSPSVNITYPLGGEMKSQDFNVEATLSDADSTVSNVSFYYTTDDGISGSLICSDASDPYSCQWSIGQTAEDIYKVKAIATSDDGGRNWSISDYVYIDSSPTINIYNFNYSGNEKGHHSIYKKAWTEDNVSGRPNVDDPGSLGTEVTSDANNSVATPDNQRYVVSEDLGCGSYNFTNAIIFKFYINETLINISNIKLQWQGYGYAKSGYLTNMSIWNFTISLWDTVAYKNFIEAGDDDLKYSLTSGFSSYLDPINNTMYILVETLEKNSYGCGGWGVFICPLYLSWNGSEYRFETEGILGIFSRHVETPTYDRLYHLRPQDGALKIAIAEIVEEKTRMDSAELIAVDHGKGVDVLLDSKGIPHTIKNPKKVLCKDRFGNDCTRLLEKADEKAQDAKSSFENGLVGSRSLFDPLLENGPEGSYWVSNLSALDLEKMEGRRDYIELTLPEPDVADAEEDSPSEGIAKLVISASDTGFLGESESNLFGIAGDSLPYLYRMLDNPYFGGLGGGGIGETAGMRIQVLDENDGWVDYPERFDNALAGSYRTLLFPLKKALIKNNRIRINTLVYAYAIDYAAVDYSADDIIHVSSSKPDIASLQEDDGSRLELGKGSFAELSFKDPPKPGENSGKGDAIGAGDAIDALSERDYFLKTEGYYHPGEKEGMQTGENGEMLYGNDSVEPGIFDAISAFGRVRNSALYMRMMYDHDFAEEYMLDYYLDEKSHQASNQAAGNPGQRTDRRAYKAGTKKHNSLYTDFVRATVSGCIVPVDNLEILENTTFCANGYFTVPDADGNGRVIQVLADNVTLDCAGSVIDSGGSDNAQENDGRGTGIGVDQANKVTVKNCNVSRYGVGMGVNRSMDVLFMNNTAVLNYIGMGADNTNNSVFRNNIVIGSYYVGYGLTEGSSNITITNNTATNTTLLAYALEGADNSTLEFNYANGSASQGSLHLAGIGLTKGAYYNTISNNTINDLDLGIGLVDVGFFLGQGTYGVAGKYNNFTSNTISNMYVNGIGMLYPYDDDYYNYFDQNNLVEGEKVYYYLGVHGTAESYVQISALNLTAGNTSMFTGKISLVNCSYINITDSNVSGNFYGIFVLDSHDVLLSNNIAYNNGEVPVLVFATGGTVVGAGYVIINSENVSLSGNNATENFYGYYAKNSRNITLVNNKAQKNSWVGYYINSTNVSAFINNSADLNDVAAYTFAHSWFNTIANNTAKDALEIGSEDSKTERRKGFYFADTFNNTITNNIASNCSYGFYIDATNETIANNTIFNNSVAGIIFANCPEGSMMDDSSNVVENNTGMGYFFDNCIDAAASGLNTTGNNGAGFGVYNSHYLTLSDLWSKNNYYNYYINSSYNTTIARSLSINSTSHEVYFYDSRDSSIVDSIIINNVSGNDAYSEENSWNYFLNTSLNKSNLGDATNSNASVQWYLDLFVQSNESVPMAGASIFMNNSINNYSAVTGSNAWARLNLTEFVAAGGVNTYYSDSNYTWNITKAGYGSDMAMVNMSQNRNLTVTLSPLSQTLFWDYGDVSLYGRISADFTDYIDKWAHVVLVSNGTNNNFKAIYINGNLVASETTSDAPGTALNGLTLGGAMVLSLFRHFSGAMDDLKIWNRTLSENEIRLLYENKTNVTHADATTAGENWTVNVIPIDQYGLNGSGLFSNSVNITGMQMNVVNQTPSNIPSQAVNETEPINPNQNLTIRLNVTAVGGGLESVWIKVWQTIKSAALVLWQGIMSFIGGLWQVNVPVNYSYPGGLVNYTAYANLTGGNVTEIEGNFSVNRPPSVSSAVLNATSSSNSSADNLTANPVSASDADGHAIEFNYNWLKNGSSDTVLNMPFTAPDLFNRTYDFSGYANHGNVSGAVWNRTGGYNGKGAYEFDGADDKITLGHSNSINLSSNMTVTAWVFMKNVFPAAWTGIAMKWDAYGLRANSDGTKITFFSAGSSTCIATDPTAASSYVGKWVFVAGLHNGTNCVLYIDGSNVNSGTAVSTVTINTNPFFVGYEGTSSRYFNGTIDDVRVYNRSLSANEIRLLYANKTNVTHSDATGRVGRNWTVKVTPIDSYGLNGSSVFSNSIYIPVNIAPVLASVKLNSTSLSNTSDDNLTASAVATDPDNDGVELNYNWYRNGTSDTVLNMPMTQLDGFNRTYDLSGYNNHGNVTNATWNATGGYNGFGAYRFVGSTTSTINVSNSTTLNMKQLSISLWFKSYNNTRSIITRGVSRSTSSTRDWDIFGDGTSLTWLGTNNTGTIWSVTTPYPALNTWHHLVVLWDGTTNTNGVRMYLNGTWVVNGTATNANLSNLFGIAMGGSGIYSFNGTIDEVRIWNRTLSDNEIRLLYENKTNVTHADTTNASENWTVKVTPIDSYGLNGTSMLSNGVVITNSGPRLTSVLLNATSPDNMTVDNLTAYPGAVADSEGDNYELNYNWYRNNISDTALNLPMTAPDINGMTYDMSGNNNHGTLYYTVFNSTGGHDGFGAYEFNRTNWIDLGNNPTVNFSGTELTINAWIKPMSTPPSWAGYIISNSRDCCGYYGGYSMLMSSDGYLGCSVWNGTNNYIIYTTYNLSEHLNEWHNVACLLNSTSLRAYINGAVNYTSTFNEWHVGYAPYNTYIGKLGHGQWYLFNGTIDDVRIWNRTLSANEIALLYEDNTDVMHADATGDGGESWKVKVTPIDINGLNGSSVFSNSLNITQMVLNFFNQTNPSNELINETNAILMNKNLTIRVNATAVGGGLQSVWINIWQTVKDAANIIWQGIMSLIGGFWQVNVLVNNSFPNATNYTIYANLTGGNVTQIEGNFSVIGLSIFNCTDLNNESTIYVLANNISGPGTCLHVKANNVTIDGNGYQILYGLNATTYQFGITTKGYNGTTIRNAFIKEGTATGNYKHAIYLNGSINATIYSNVINVSGANSCGIILDTKTNQTNVTNNNISALGATLGYGVYALTNSNLNTISANWVWGTAIGIYSYANSNTISNNTVLSSTGTGIYMRGDRHVIDNNKVTVISGLGIYIYLGSYNNLTNNSANSSQGTSYLIYGTTWAQHNNTMGRDNLAEGKPVNYTFNSSNYILDSIDFTEYGEVMFGWARNITIRSSNFSLDSLVLASSKNFTIINNYINSSTGHGIYLYSVANANNISNNTINISCANCFGVLLSTNPSSNIIANNTIQTRGASGHGIYLTSGVTSNNVSKNLIQSWGNSVYGIIAYTTANSNWIKDNTIVGNGTSDAGIWIYNNNFNIVTNNSITEYGASSYGIYMRTVTSTYINNSPMNIYGNTAYGIFLYGPITNLTMSDINVQTNGTVSLGLYNQPLTVFNFSIKDSVLNASRAGVADIFFSNRTSGIWNFTNVSFADFNYTGVANGTFIVSNYLDAYAGYSNGYPAPQVNITGADITGLIAFSELTAQNGLIGRKVLTDYIIYNGTPTGLNISYFSNYTFNASLDPFPNQTQLWNMSVYNNLTFIFTNNVPSNVSPLSPTNNNVTVFERTPMFIWESATDDDVGDTITYTINISHATCPSIIVGNITFTNYTPTENLCIDTATFYNWTVYASDGKQNSTGRNMSGFKISSVFVLTLVNGTVNFSDVSINEEHNTSYDGAPDPFVIRNDGNVEVNLTTFSANKSLWNDVELNTNYFQFKANNRTTEPGSFNWSGSQTTWANVTNISVVNMTAVYNLSWVDTNDTAEIDIRIVAPPAEPEGPKYTNVYITGAMV